MAFGTTNYRNLQSQLNYRKQRKTHEREKNVVELLRKEAIKRMNFTHLTPGAFLSIVAGHLNNPLYPELHAQILASRNQYGLPRAFRVLLGGHDTVHVQEKVADKSFYVDEGHIIRFPAFGKLD
jgi:hypothetical protein